MEFLDALTNKLTICLVSLVFFFSQVSTHFNPRAAACEADGFKNTGTQRVKHDVGQQLHGIFSIALLKMPTKIDRSAICSLYWSHINSPRISSLTWNMSGFQDLLQFSWKVSLFLVLSHPATGRALFGLRQHMTSFLLAVLKATNSMQPGDGTCWPFRVSFCDSHFFSLPMTCPSKKISAVECSVLALWLFGFNHPSLIQFKACLSRLKGVQEKCPTNIQFPCWQFIPQYCLASESLHSRRSGRTRTS